MKVNVISQNEHVVLVEYVDGSRYRRVIVPAHTVAGEECAIETLALGVEDGKQWSALIDDMGTAQQIENELRRRGIWNSRDMAGRPEEVKSAFIAVAYSMYSRFVRAVRQTEEK